MYVHAYVCLAYALKIKVDLFPQPCVRGLQPTPECFFQDAPSPLKPRISIQGAASRTELHSILSRMQKKKVIGAENVYIMCSVATCMSVIALTKDYSRIDF